MAEPCRGGEFDNDYDNDLDPGTECHVGCMRSQAYGARTELASAECMIQYYIALAMALLGRETKRERRSALVS